MQRDNLFDGAKMLWKLPSAPAYGVKQLRAGPGVGRKLAATKVLVDILPTFHIYKYSLPSFTSINIPRHLYNHRSSPLPIAGYSYKSRNRWLKALQGSTWTCIACPLSRKLRSSETRMACPFRLALCRMASSMLQISALRGKASRCP